MNKFVNKDENIILTVKEDFSEAALTLLEQNFPFNEADIIKLIEEAELTYGFENAKTFLEENNIEKEFNRPFPIAIADNVQMENKIEYYFNKNKSFDPETFSDNYSELDKMETILADTPLAKIISSKTNSGGKNILGEEISNLDDKEFSIKNLLGENVQYEENTQNITALKKGYPYVDKTGKFHVKTDFEINKDLEGFLDDFEVFGNLTINGNVKTSAKITVTGNLKINGDVDGAFLEVKGNIKVDGDIMNCKENGIWAAKNIVFNSADNSRIVTEGSIRFYENCYFCRLIAAENIIGHEEKSRITGGFSLAGEKIEAAIIGNSNGMSTDIEITYCPYIKERLLIGTKKAEQLKKENGDPQKILQIEKELNSLESELSSKITQLLTGSKTLPNQIIVYKRIFSGVYLRILRKSKTIIKDRNRVLFNITKGELVTDEF